MKILITVGLTLSISTTTFAEVTPRVRSAVDNYLHALDAVKLKKAPIETAFTAISQVRDAFVQPITDPKRRENLSGPIELIPENEYINLKQTLESNGLIIERNEVVLVEVDPMYFLKIAKQYGDSGDIIFFEDLKWTYPSIFRVYESQVTDYSACISYGDGKVTAAYGLWHDYARQFPKRYAQKVHDEIESVDSELENPGCICHDANSLKTELRQFQKEFPLSPLRQRVQKRLEKLEHGGAEERFNCHPN